ncbi:hypothetical protein ACX80N_12475 [Arthrobacter sp. MDT2-16]
MPRTPDPVARAARAAAKAERRRLHRENSALVQVGAANILELPWRVLTDSMKRQGIKKQITVQDARRSKHHPSELPQWVAELLDQKEAARIREEEAQQSRLAAAREAVAVKLLAGQFDAISSDMETLVASDMAFRASKDLLGSDGSTAHLLDVEVAALKWAGVDPHDSETWIVGPRH